MQRRVWTTMLVSLVTQSLPLSAFAAIWRIEPDGTGDAATIQAGIDLAVAGDTILLAPGVFTGVGNKDVSFAGKDVHVTSEAGAASTIVDCEGTGRAFALFQGESSAATIADLTIQGGNPGQAGGAIFCASASPTITECVFLGNQGAGGNTAGGGAIFATSSDITIDGCEFRDNSVPGVAGFGGAVAIAFASATVTDCLFANNGTTPTMDAVGGAISAWSAADVTISGCTFLQNGSGSGGGGVGIVFASFSSIAECEFVENQCVSGGGGLVVQGPAACVGCSFRDNQATLGGGAKHSGGSVLFEGCEFDGNAASLEGGGLWLSFGSATVRECLFRNNRSDATGGGATIVDVIANFVNCTFYFNQAASGANVSARRVQDPTQARFTRSILSFGSGTSVDCQSGATATAQCTDVVGNSGGDWVACLAGQEGLSGNFTADPLFCNAAGGDFTLRPESPCAPPGENGCGLVGAFPVGCTPISVAPMSWAGIKAMYRDGR